jgi:hypothetical protein
MKSPSEIQQDTVNLKYTQRLAIEKLRHKNIMLELEFMAKHKIKCFDRMENRGNKK